ncbi:MAG: nucleoside triphosphate pyrophosphatase [Nannocystaceae bacterium]
MPTAPPLVLASASPRRADLLRAAGLDPLIAPVDCDETWRPGEHPTAYAARVTRDKAILGMRPGARILAADTTVWIAGDRPPLGKPHDRGDARAMLTALIDAEVHQVTTAFALVDTSGAEPRWITGASTTAVHFRRLRAAALEAYLDCEEWRGKAGGYAIQGRAAGIVRRLEGSYTGVVGLPLAEVLDALDALARP